MKKYQTKPYQIQKIK